MGADSIKSSRNPRWTDHQSAIPFKAFSCSYISCCVYCEVAPLSCMESFGRTEFCHINPPTRLAPSSLGAQSLMGLHLDKGKHRLACPCVKSNSVLVWDQAQLQPEGLDPQVVHDHTSKAVKTVYTFIFFPPVYQRSIVCKQAGNWKPNATSYNTAMKLVHVYKLVFEIVPYM